MENKEHLQNQLDHVQKLRTSANFVYAHLLKTTLTGDQVPQISACFDILGTLITNANNDIQTLTTQLEKLNGDEKQAKEPKARRKKSKD